MPATTAQLVRTAAPKYDFQRRFWIGPPPEYVLFGEFTAGLPVTLPLATKTTGPIGVNTSTIPVLSTTGYPTAGMIGVVTSLFTTNGPQLATLWYEYTGKTSNSFTGCLWRRGFEGTILAGATCGSWLNLTERVIESSVRGRWTRSGTKIDWRYDAEGYYFNSTLMARDASVLIERRHTPNGTGLFGQWSGWEVEALGFIRKWQVEGDANAMRRWDAVIESISTYVERHHTSARRYGQANIAPGASITASTPLANVYLESAVEFRGGTGTVVPENVADENPDTLYISSEVPTQQEELETEGSGPTEFPQIDEVGVWYSDTYPNDLQWLVIRLPRDAGGPTDPPDPEGRGKLYIQGINLKNFVLTYSGTVYRPSNVSTWPPEIGGCIDRNGQRYCSTKYIRLPDVTLDENNPVIVLCRNAAAFRRYYVVESGTQVFDWRFLGGFGNDGMPSQDIVLNPLGEVLHLRYVQSGEEHHMRDMLAWGDPAEFAGKFFENAQDFAYHNTQWNETSTVDIPLNGHSIRRMPACKNSNRSTDWGEEPEPMPGSTRSSNNGIFVSLELSDWEAHLSREWTTDPLAPYFPAEGDIFTLDDMTDLDYPSGVLQVGTEHIRYTWDRERQGLRCDERGANGTVPAEHTTDELVYLIDSVLGAHRLPHVEKIRWKRWMRSFPAAGGGPEAINVNIAPRTVEIFGATNPEVSYPGDGDWKSTWEGGDYLRLWDHKNLRTTPRDVTITLDPARRLKHVMLRVRRMSDLDVEGYSGRGKFNEIEIYKKHIVIGRGEPTGSEFAGVGGVLKHLVAEVLASGQIEIDPGAFTNTSGNVDMAEGGLGSILDDLCEKNMLVRKYTKDGKLQIMRAPLHPFGTRPEVMGVFNKDMIRGRLDVFKTTYPSRRGEIGQYLVRMKDPTTGQTYIGTYPPNLPRGQEVEPVNVEWVGASTEAAIHYATALYLANPEISREVSFATVGPCDWLEPGHRIIAFDGSDDAAPLGRSINVLVDGVDQTEEGFARIIGQEWQMV